MVDDTKRTADSNGGNGGAGGNGGGAGGNGNGAPQGYINDWSHPIVWIAISIIAGITALIAFSLLGWDSDFVIRLGSPQFARGLITYIFAVTTTGMALGLVVSGLISSGHGEGAEERFRRGKDVLGLLLGVFGTIVGYYFGSETSSSATLLTVTAPEIRPETVTAGETATLTAAVLGGLPPYRFAVALGAEAEYGGFGAVQRNGVISYTVETASAGETGEIEIRLRVADSGGTVADRSVDLEIAAPSPDAGEPGEGEPTPE